MRHALLFLVLLLGTVSTAQAETFIGSGDVSNAANWSLGYVPGSGDAVIFDGSATGPVTFDIPLTVASISVTSTFTSSITQAAAVTTSGAFSANGGTWSAGSQLLTVGGAFSVAASGATFDAGTGSVVLNGSSTLSNPSNSFATLTIASGVTTTLTSDVIVSHLASVAGQLVFTHWVTLHLRGSGNLLNVTGRLNAISPYRGIVAFESSGSAPVYVPGGSYGWCQLSLNSLGGAAADFEQTGSIVNIDSFLTAADTASGTVLWDTNAFDLVSSSWLALGDYGSSLGGTIVHAGSSHITAPALCWFTTGEDQLNLESSTWTVGEWAVWDAGVAVDPGTSTVVVNTGIGPFWTTVPHQFYNLTINGSCPLYGPIAVGNNLTVVSGGTLQTENLAVSVGHDLIVQSGGSLVAGSSAIIVGSDITIDGHDGAFQAGTSSVTLNGPGTLSDPDQTNAFYDLSVAASGATVLLGTDVTSLHSTAVIAGALDFHNGPGATLHLQGTGHVFSNNGSLNAGFGNGGYVRYENASSTSPMYVEGGSYGWASLGLVSLGGAQATMTQDGDIVNIDDFLTTVDTTGGNLHYLTNGHNLTSSSWLSIGDWGSALGGTTMDCSNSEISVPGIAWFTTPSDVLNLQTSTWTVSLWGGWDSTTLINPGQSTVIANGDIGAFWESLPQPFYNLVINAPGSEATAFGEFDLAGTLSIVAGTLNTNGNAIVAAGNVLVDPSATLDAAGTTVELAGTGAQTLTDSSSSTIGHLLIDGGVRTVTLPQGAATGSLTVEPGATLTVGATTTVTTYALTMNGTAALPITVNSTIPGSAGKLILATSGTQSLAYVAAQDSNATGGPIINDLVHGTNNGGNTNWNFGTITSPPPSFLIGPSETIANNAGPQTVNAWVTAITPSGGGVSFTVTVDQGSLFSGSPQVSSNGTLSYTPAAGSSGTAHLSVTAVEVIGGQTLTSAAQSASITIVPAPTFAIGPGQTLPENSPAQSIAPWITAITPSGGGVTFSVRNSNPTLFQVAPQVSPTGTLTYTPAANATGSAQLTIIAMAIVSGLPVTSTSQFSTITLTHPVTNGPTPQFQLGDDQYAFGVAGTQSVPQWVTNIQPGTAGESVTFTVSVDQPAAFSALPSIDSTGNLTYTPTLTVPGYITTVTVTAHDANDSGTSSQIAHISTFNDNAEIQVGFGGFTNDKKSNLRIISGPGGFVDNGINGGAIIFPGASSGTFVLSAPQMSAYEVGESFPRILTEPSGPMPASSIVSFTVGTYTVSCVPCYIKAIVQSILASRDQSTAGGAPDAAGVQPDGNVIVGDADLASGGMSSWGQARSFSSIKSAAGSTVGHGWQENGRPCVCSIDLPSGASGATGAVSVVVNPTTSFAFTLINGVYTPAFGVSATLVDDRLNSTFVLTDSHGGISTFFDFSVPTLSGQLKGYQDPGGNLTAPFYDVSGNLTSVVQTAPSGEVNTYAYRYVTIPGYPTQTQSIALSEGSGSTSTLIRTVHYAYYTGLSTDAGNLGDLQSSTITDGTTGKVVDLAYYRYYKAGEPLGYQGGLKMKITTTNYNRAVADGFNPLTATDAQLMPYVNAFYQYSQTHLVTKAEISGAGCSCAGSIGVGIFRYSYLYSSAGMASLENATLVPLDNNSWALKKTTVMMDEFGHTLWTKIEYSNTSAQPLATVFTGDGVTTITVNQYDAQNRLIQTDMPTAVLSIDDTQENLGVVLKPTDGLISGTDYAATTTATATQPGTVASYQTDTWIAHGSTGPHILQSSTDYIQHSDAGGNVVTPEADATVYRSDDPAHPVPLTTKYTYTWQGSTNQMASMVTTYPVVAAAENGSGVADSETQLFDSYGRVQWSLDGDGYITYHAYDQNSGAEVETITDVDMTRTAGLLSVPAWETPVGGGLHVITTMQVDGLGRTTEMTDPDGFMTYTVYDDPNHIVRTYPGWNPVTGQTTGPIQVSRDDQPGRYQETLTMSATPTTSGSPGALVPTGQEAFTSLQTLSRTYLDAGNRPTVKDDYVLLTGLAWSSLPSIGTLGVNYYETSYGYDVLGNQVRVQNQVGTISRSIYDTRTRVISTWTGTHDQPISGYWSPTNNTSPCNMVQVWANIWDQGGPGDNTLTSTTTMPTGSTADNRTTASFYDWRDRQVATKSGVQATEDSSTHRPLVVCQLDNLGECLQQQTFDSDGLSVVVTSGVLTAPDPSRLRALTVSRYDDRQRIYQTEIFPIDQTNGAIAASALTTNTCYDHRGQTVAVFSPGGQVHKTSYDGLGRSDVSSTTDGAAGMTWTASLSTAGDHVLEQHRTSYDGRGNAIFSMLAQRMHNAVGTGDLQDPAGSPAGRLSYALSYFDAASRTLAQVELGTNGGTPYALSNRPPSVPTGSDTVLVTSTSYNQAGWVATTTDARGIVTLMTYDNLGRVVERIEAWDGTAMALPSATANRITLTSYDGLGHTTLLTAENYIPATNQVQQQSTRYQYGVTQPSSVVASNDLLEIVAYPDPVTGTPSSSAANQEVMTYLATGQVASKTDGNGNVHQYSYDVVGQQLTDAVTILGAGVDGGIRRLDTAYDTGRRPYLFTSSADLAGSEIVNQVQRSFNGLGQLVLEQQSPFGAVGALTNAIAYGYTYLAGGVNNSRLSSVTYPNGRVLTYGYQSGLDDAISRVSFLADAGGSSQGTELEAYSYVGLSSIVQRTHSEPSLISTLIQQTGDPISDGGDQYTGLDRFGRLIDCRWINTGSSQPTDRFQYAYDRTGQKLYQNNLVNPAFSVLYHANGASETTAYDNFNRITASTRGTLSASGSNGLTLDTVAMVANPTNGHPPIYGNQDWTLDQLGNWSSVINDGTTDTRTHNLQNEVTATNAGAIGYDSNGNLTSQAGNTANTFDAWNRATGIRGVSYRYDALGRRVWESANGGRAFFYSGQQMIETRLGAEGSLGPTSHEQYVYGIGYIDEVVLRDRAADGGGGDLGAIRSGLNERLYYQQDREFNVTALISQDGEAVERYAYDPYGGISVFSPTWNVLISDSAVANQVGFTGRWLDETGMWYFRARYLDPILGRFVERDSDGNIDGVNLYNAYFVPNSMDSTGNYDERFEVGWNTYGWTDDQKVRILQSFDRVDARISDYILPEIHVMEMEAAAVPCDDCLMMRILKLKDTMIKEKKGLEGTDILHLRIKGLDSDTAAITNPSSRQVTYNNSPGESQINWANGGDEQLDEINLHELLPTSIMS